MTLLSEADLHLSPMSDRATACGATITDLKVGETGYVRSPNYPADYPADIKCVWWLKVGQVLPLHTMFLFIPRQKSRARSP